MADHGQLRAALDQIDCEVHENCPEPVVAKIGVPSPAAKWTCERGFNEWRQEKEPKQ